jgi:hypothetical protein
VRRACEPRDSEASSILRAFSKLDIERAQKISEEFAVEIQKTSEDERDGKESSLWEDFERRDESGEDYVIDLNGQNDDAG